MCTRSRRNDLKTMVFSKNSNALLGMSIYLKGGWLGAVARPAARSQMTRGALCSAKDSAWNPLAGKRY